MYMILLYLCWSEPFVLDLCVIFVPVFLRVASLALSCELVLKNVGKLDHNITTTKHNNMRICAYFMGYNLQQLQCLETKTPINPPHLPAFFLVLVVVVVVVFVPSLSVSVLWLVVDSLAVLAIFLLFCSSAIRCVSEISFCCPEHEKIGMRIGRDHCVLLKCAHQGMFA